MPVRPPPLRNRLKSAVPAAVVCFEFPGSADRSPSLALGVPVEATGETQHEVSEESDEDTFRKMEAEFWSEMIELEGLTREVTLSLDELDARIGSSINSSSASALTDRTSEVHHETTTPLFSISAPKLRRHDSRDDSPESTRSV